LATPSVGHMRHDEPRKSQALVLSLVAR
jgi:hypothetical protein